MEFLFEYQGSRRQFTSTKEGVCEKVREELRNHGKECTAVAFARPESSHSSDYASKSEHAYILQKWSTKWDTFVDVDSLSNLVDGDKLSVVAKPCGSPHRACTGRAESIISKVKKPTELEAKALATYFKSSGVTAKRPTQAFDPTAEAVGETQRKKKKAWKQATKPKSTNVLVVFMKYFQSKIPRGKERTKLSDRIRKVPFNRTQNPGEAKKAILNTFKDLQSLQDFTVLESVQSNILRRAKKQQISGEDAIQRRGALYLCEKYTVEVSSDSEEDEHAALSTKADTMIADLRRTLDETEDEESDHVHVFTSSEPEDPQSPLSPSPATRTPVSEILESRQIREEQDRAFAESLRADREKDAQRDMEQTRHEAISTLRNLLKKRQEENQKAEDTMQFSLRLPNASKVNVFVKANSSTEVLYESAFAVSGLNTPFYIYQVAPRKIIPIGILLTDIELQERTLLIVEECCNAPDPLTYLQCDVTSMTSNHEQHCTSVMTSELDELGHDMVEYDSEILQSAKGTRTTFMNASSFHRSTVEHTIKRSSIFSDVTKLYSDISITNEFPFRIEFDGERAVGTGVTRDLFSAFWQSASQKVMDGRSLLVPAVHPHVDQSAFPVMGSVLSHGYLCCGFLPVCVAFPVLAHVLLGPTSVIPPPIMMESFFDYIGAYDADVLRGAIKTRGTVGENFPPNQHSKLISLLSVFGCRELPSPHNIVQLVSQVANHVLTIVPGSAVYAMNSGIPIVHRSFWSFMTVADFHSLYKALSATAAAVLAQIREPDDMNSAEQRIFGYLKTFIGSLQTDDLRNFLRFTTGSSVPSSETITVNFNVSSTGLARCPTAHTCASTLQLPLAYATYVEFKDEFLAILRSQEAYVMDIV